MTLTKKYPRRKFLKTALATAVAAALGINPLSARPPRGFPTGTGGGGGYVNPIAFNFAAGGTGDRYDEGFPIFKNRIREGGGFQSVATGNGSALSSAGWPTEDTQFNLLYAGVTALPSWASGNWSCGFIGTGSETITAHGNCSVSSIVPGTGGAYTTFTLTPTAVGFGFTVTGTTGGVINVFAYLPAFNTLNTIDFLPSASSVPSSAYIPAAVSFYQQCEFIRIMTLINTLDWAQQVTSSNRLTLANCQAPVKNWNGGGFTTGTFTALPASGNTSATLTTWLLGPGTFALQVPCSGSPSGYSVIIATISSSATSNVACTFAALASNTPTSNAFKTGSSNQPISWMIGLANACGTTGLYINLPLVEDGAQYGSGSWSAALMTELANTYTSTGPLYFELGNEFFEGNLCTSIGQYLSYIEGYQAFSSNGISWDYLSYRLQQQATAIQVKFSSKFGTSVFNVLGCQTQGNGFNMTSYVPAKLASTYGGIALNYIHKIAIAPYGNPTFGASDSVSTLISEIESAISTAVYGAYVERIGVQAAYFGLGLMGYEANVVQWNGYSNSSGTPNNGNPNYGSTILNSGYSTPVQQYVQSLLNSGLSPIPWFTDGVCLDSGSAAPIDEITTPANYSSINSSPVMTALLPFTTAFTPTRNVVSASGSVVTNANAADNIAANLSNNGYNTGAVLYGKAGYAAWVVQCTAPGTYTVVGTFSSGTGSPTTSLAYASPQNAIVTSASGVTLANGAVTLGTVVLKQGTNYVYIGNGSTNSYVPTQLQFN